MSITPATAPRQHFGYARCSVCERSQPLAKDGTIRMHRDRLKVICTGTGETPAATVASTAATLDMLDAVLAGLRTTTPRTAAEILGEPLAATEVEIDLTSVEAPAAAAPAVEVPVPAARAPRARTPRVAAPVEGTVYPAAFDAHPAVLPVMAGGKFPHLRLIGASGTLCSRPTVETQLVPETLGVCLRCQKAAAKLA